MTPEATACETALWPACTFARAYEANRKAAVADAVDADPVAACVCEIMAQRGSWTGSAADLLRAGADLASDGVSRRGSGWPQNPRALAGRLRRAQPGRNQDHQDAHDWRPRNLVTTGRASTGRSTCATTSQSPSRMMLTVLTANPACRFG